MGYVRGTSKKGLVLDELYIRGNKSGARGIINGARGSIKDELWLSGRGILSERGTSLS